MVGKRALVAGACMIAAGALLDVRQAQATSISFIANEGNGALRDGYTANSTYAGALGTMFTVGSFPLTVTDLGYFDGPNSAAGSKGDGLLASHEVGIFTSGGTLVSGLDVTVPAGGGTLNGDFRYVNLSTPVVLSANTTYVLAGQVQAGDEAATGDVFMDQSASETLAAGAFTTTFQARFTGSASGNPSFNNGTFAFPGDNGTAKEAYLGPNFLFTPEPASAGLMGLATVGLLSRRRRCIFP